MTAAGSISKASTTLFTRNFSI